jgi:DNA-binding CsgD family transcriptional regulator
VAVAVLEQLVAAERTHEEAHLSLMQLYARLGQRRRALRQYQLLSAALHDDLDAVPNPECEALYHAIAARTFPTGPTRVRVGALAGGVRPFRGGVHQGVHQKVHRTLTQREEEIAMLIGRGLTNREIGLVLGVAKRTVDTHVGRMLHKLGLSSRHQVTTYTYANSAVPLRRG